jgi:hypothetical protein
MSNQVSVLITASEQVSVETILPDQVTIETIFPDQPTTIQANVPGPQGPQGPRLVGSLRIDTSTIGIIYIGTAPQDSLEQDAVWTITRSVFNTSGIRTSKDQATDVTWTDRFSHTYS